MIPHRVLAARAVRAVAFGVIALFVLTVALSLAACDRPPCWESPACDTGRN